MYKHTYANDSIDKDCGCPSFLLFKRLENFDDIVLVVKAKRELFQKGIYYNLNIEDTIYNSFLFDIHLDVYKSKGIHKSYCGDIDITNFEIPISLKCISGNLKFFIDSGKNKNSEIITLQILDAVFEKKSGSIKNIKISKVLFYKVLISEWGG